MLEKLNMAENEYIPKQDVEKEETSSSLGNKKSKNSEKKTESKEQRKFPSLGFKVNTKKLKTTIGVLMILFAFYLFLACFSYIFTWSQDQSRVLNKGLFEFLFENDPVEVTNWLGKFGAWTSHLLIFKWFGLPSFGLIFLLFLSGIKVLLDTEIFPLRKTMGRIFLLTLWSSIFLGYFASHLNYIGGSFGYYLTEWLSLSLGRIGAIIFICALGYLLVAIVFNADLKLLFNRLFNNSERQLENVQAHSENDNGYKPNNNLDIHAVNTIQDDDIEQDFISETYNFDDEDESDDEDLESESELYVELPENYETELDIEQESSNISDIEVADMSVEVAKPDASLDADELNDLRKEFGDYDPTLDLSSYVLPPIDLLKEYGSSAVSVNKQELEDNKNKIVETLSHYKIDIAKIKATVGPTVTLYEIVPAPGVRISKIKNLEDDIALSLSALGIRIIAPIPGKGTIGIEVPNSKPEMVSMRSLIASEKFQNSDAELPIVMGKTITNETFTFDLTKMPHLLVAGATGQGKSVGLNAILISILYKKHPAQVKFVLVDPKKVELTLYNKIERHFLAKLPGEEDAIITDVSKVVNTLNSLCIEMDDRYGLLKDAGVRTIIEYNAKFIARKLNPEKGHRYLPYIVVLIDEFADLIMTAGKEVEHPIARLAQLARAIGIHLIVATQRPSVNVITGMIKANFPARIAFRVLSKIDSRTILDASGADQLIGRGDMLISTGSDLKRLQCGFVDTPEVEDICSFIGEQRAYPEALLLPEYVGEGGDGSGDFDMNEIDPMFAEAAQIVVVNQQGSASLLQRKLKLGYNRAGRIVDQLEGMGIIGQFQGSKAREVLFGDLESLNEYLKSKGVI
jgi:S-DNA-T family DNA segregation ATPase FtsK/SpoIIIE